MPRNPSVTRRAVLTPLPSSSALVPTVVPWQKNEMSSAQMPSALSVSIPLRMARDGSSAVVGSLVIDIAPVPSSKHTRSENVPPVSAVTRHFPNASSPVPAADCAGIKCGLRAFCWCYLRPARGGVATRRVPLRAQGKRRCLGLHLSPLAGRGRNEALALISGEGPLHRL